MGVTNRPYAGSWQPNTRKLVQYTPDALIYINGELTLPGCQKCSGRIDFQRFITEVSVDAGTDQTSSSASFSLTLPPHQQASFIRDAQFILRCGLEVHVYMRGYFPVKGLYANLDQPAGRAGTGTGTTSTTGEVATTGDKPDVAGKPVPQPGKKKLTYQQWKDGFEDTFRKVAEEEYPGDQIAQDRMVARLLVWSYNESGGIARSDYMIFGQKAGSAGAKGTKSLSITTTERRTTSGPEDGKSVNPRPDGMYVVGDLYYAGKRDFAGFASYYDAAKGRVAWIKLYGWNAWNGYSDNIKVRDPVTGKWKRDTNGNYATVPFSVEWKTLVKAFGITTSEDPKTGKTIYVKTKATENKEATQAAIATSKTSNSTPSLGPSALAQMGLAGYDLENLLAYPYYHVFHGVVNQVSFSYTGGFQTATVQCVSMLHFWQYHQMSSNASIWGVSPQNSGLKSTLLGSNFTGMHPYEIMYTLHHDTAGAAAGVSYALAQKSNQNAKTEVTGEEVFSLNLQYWKKRFDNMNIKLRMHGATGEMFNAAQSAFLASQSSSALMALLRGRFGGKGGANKEILSKAISVGLGNKPKMDALLFAKRTAGGTDPSLELSMPEMVAFVSDIGQWGSVQLFESTYESKNDIANKVCQVTGFEFYQDVDGDFVFKPPMYNLDTSASRVYRIEDIDLISINFEDKEPQATYMTCKGTPYHNQKGTGVENEWGVQGQYVDFRLVAQFGWRPGDFESSYFTDQRSMFAACVNRLDIQNAPTKSASCTIPLRPELRPGYPVYIPYLDAFFYCNSFAHSFSVGGQCATSLQLIAKRAKFFAPGLVHQTGIEAINLQNTTLPEKPLQVLDNNGRPRLSGFPNVVLALDPTLIDPLFFVVGSDLQKLGGPETLEQLMKLAVGLKLVISYPDPTKPGPYYIMSANEQESVWFYLQTPNSAPLPMTKDLPTDWIDLKTAGAAYVKAQQGVAQSLQKRSVQIKKLKQDVAQKEKVAKSMDVNSKGYAQAVAAYQKADAKAQEAVNQYDNEKNTLVGKISGDTSGKIAAFRQLIDLVKEQFIRPETFQSSFSGDPKSMTTLLDLMSNKKAIFTGNAVPGAYRYYSSAHPDIQHQGQQQLTINLTKDDSTQGKKFSLSASYLEPLWKRDKCPMYVKSDHLQPSVVGAQLPEAQLKDAIPSCGIKVFTGNPNYPEGEILPTSEIQELMFASHQVISNRRRGNKNRSYQAVISGTDFQRAWQSNAAKSIGSPTDSSTLVAALNDWIQRLPIVLQDSIASTRNSVSAWAGRIPDFPTVDVPGSITYRGGVISTTTAMNTYRFQDTEGKIEPYPESDMDNLTAMWVVFAAEFASDTFGTFLTVYEVWQDMLNGRGIPANDITKIVSVFTETLAGKTRVKITANDSLAQATTFPKKSFHPTPVFPVSDNRGYTVVGSYRYGRDVAIDPDGVFDVLHRQDILSMLNKQQVENVLRVFVHKQSIWAKVPKIIGGQTVMQNVELSGPAAESYLEEQIVKEIRNNWSDQDIIDQKLGTMVTDANGQTQLKIGLRNYMADKGKDGIQKLPVINAAYSLADLAPHTSRDFCTCKSTEADILLEVAGRQEFVQVVRNGQNTPPEDQVMLWAQNQIAQEAIPWSQSQLALRGAQPNQQPTSILQSMTKPGTK